MATAEAKPKTIGTHGSKFHTDDATSVYLLQHTAEYAGATVVRSVDADSLKGCDVVVDIGGTYDHAQRRYDHHQRGYFETFSPQYAKIKMAATGLVYRHYGREVVMGIMQEVMKPDQVSAEELELVYNKVYGDFIAAVDAGDNGISQYGDAQQLFEDRTSLHCRVERLNPSWNEDCSEAECLSRFLRASQIAGEEFALCVRSAASDWLPGRRIVSQAFAERYKYRADGRILVIQQPRCPPYGDHLQTLEAAATAAGQHVPLLYCITYDSGRKQWNSKALEKRKGSFELRLPFPAAWCGLRDAELAAASTVPGAVFVHASGFLACHPTFEGIMAMTEISLKQLPQ